MELKDALREKRIEMNLTQKALAEKLQCSVGTIQQYETGKRTPKGDMLKRLDQYLFQGMMFIEKEPEEKALEKRLQAYYQKLNPGAVFVVAEPEYTEEEIANVRRFAAYLKWSREQKEE